MSSPLIELFKDLLNIVLIACGLFNPPMSIHISTCLVSGFSFVYIHASEENLNICLLADAHVAFEFK